MTSPRHSIYVTSGQVVVVNISVAATHKQTKQFYTLYNTLDDTKLYLQKEISLLNSIHDNFTQ